MPNPRIARKWPLEFADTRKPNDNKPFIDTLYALDPSNNGVQLFMQHYNDDKPPVDVETVVQYCRNVSQPDFNIQARLKKGTAWLDDHASISRLRVSNIVQHHLTDHSIVISPRTQAESDAEQIGLPDIDCDVESDITDARATRAHVPDPRIYRDSLSARELHQHLRERRFDHSTLEDADRRLIHIINPDPCDILALTETAPEHQCSAVQGLLCHYLGNETSLKVKLSTKGYQVYQLELHLPYFALKRATQDNPSTVGRKETYRENVNLPFPARGADANPLIMHKTQFSLTICGTDNARWIAYALEDAKHDEDREVGENEHVPGWRSDQISLGQLNADIPLWDSREYFLTVCLIRVKQVTQETCNLVRTIEKAHQENTIRRQPFHRTRSDLSATSDWIQEMLALLSILTLDISKKTKDWATFMARDTGYFDDVDATLSLKSRTHIQQNLDALEDEFDRMQGFEDRLRKIEESCHKMAQRLEFRMSWQGSQNGEFTILFISPIVIVAGIFAIPAPIMSFELNTVSFVISVVVGMLSLYILLLLNGGGLRRHGWWLKLTRRITGARQSATNAVAVENDDGERETDGEIRD